ncbi:hypothetical protein FXV77_09405 [Sphingobacterium phlebotomi]|uniref:Uncharacterized protein n=1 Tax=Sphingobacterium phlebotomi TaxID=2605433 RepID=A0A5D4HB25_9SPHI|nr:hypothetical protein [Sphingobacterium phlebotomi]TYR36705.1 hypothetical protein FXV77_09405 [Sphingobacterium phlebotomi]
MTGLQEMVFIDEIALQAKIAKRAADRLIETHDTFDKIEVWCSIQSILVAAGNVSKILWPSSKKYKQRGERLRQMLKVENDNPISDRKFRNHFEHYDERVEDWFKNSPSAVYIDQAMNPSLQSRNLNTHRGYNSFNNTLVFRSADTRASCPIVPLYAL